MALDDFYKCHICGETKPVADMVPTLVTRCKECHVKRGKENGTLEGCAVGAMQPNGVR